MTEKRGLFEDKRGQGLSVNAIILIILGLVVLVALIIGFTFGFQGLKDRFSTSNNVGTIVSACQTACATNVQYDFCTSPRDLKADSVQIKDVTCFYLADKKPEFGIAKCGAITCTNSVLLSEPNFQSYVCPAENSGKTVYNISADGTALLNKKCEVIPT